MWLADLFCSIEVKKLYLRNDVIMEIKITAEYLKQRDKSNLNLNHPDETNHIVDGFMTFSLVRSNLGGGIMAASYTLVLNRSE